MLRTIVLLVLAIMVIFLIWRAIAEFWMWLSRGKLLESAVKNEEVEESVRIAIQNAQAYEAERQLEKHHHGKKPRLTRDQRKVVFKHELQRRDRFLDDLRIGWFQIVMLFLIGSVLGLILEHVWMFITAGLTQSRVGLVWGPFSPLYGVGATLLTLITFAMRKKNVKLWVVFLVAVVVGGTLEQITGWGMETFFGMISWDYSHVPGAITKWVAVPFLFFWGILGVIWYKAVMPNLLYAIGVPTTRRQLIFIVLLTIYLATDIFITVSAFVREDQRNQGIPPANAYEVWLDENYSDKWMANRFQNMSEIDPATGSAK